MIIISMHTGYIHILAVQYIRDLRYHLIFQTLYLNEIIGMGGGG